MEEWVERAVSRMICVRNESRNLDAIRDFGSDIAIALRIRPAP